MTYTESAALMVDIEFRGRIKVACLTYAKYIMDEAGSTPAHNSRMKWAGQTYQSPDQVAQQVQHPTVMDAAVQADGAAITDSGLQSAVEKVVNQTL